MIFEYYFVFYLTLKKQGHLVFLDVLDSLFEKANKQRTFHIFVGYLKYSSKGNDEILVY